MPALKKLIAPGSNFPPAEIHLDSQEATGKTTPVNVKQVKDKDGNILWGRYEITTASNIKEFEENYCDSFKLDFVNPSYGKKEGEYITAAYNIFSYRHIPLSYSVIGYHGEQLSCEYELKYPYYYRIFSNSGNYLYVTGFESGRASRDGTDPYSSEITGDTTLSTQNNLGLTFTANKKFGKLNYTQTTSKNTANGGTMTTKVFKNDAQVSSGSYIYHEDNLKLRVTHAYPINGKLPISGTDYPLKLDGLATNFDGSVNTTNTHSYLKTPYSTISLPTYFTRYDYPLRIDSVTWAAQSVTTDLGTKTGYEFKANLIRHALADVNKDIPIAICCNTPEFSISGPKVVTANFTSVTKYYEASTTFNEVLFASMDSMNRAANPFKDDNNRAYLENSTSVTRPASRASTVGSTTMITQLNKPSLCNIYYIYDGTFYCIDCLANTVASSQTVIEPTVTIVNNPRVEFTSDDASVVYAHAPNILLTLPVGCEFSGTVDWTWTWELYGSEGSLQHETGSDYRDDFSSTGSGITFNRGDIEIDNDFQSRLSGFWTAAYTVDYTLYIGDQIYSNTIRIEDIQVEETYGEY